MRIFNLSILSTSKIRRNDNLLIWWVVEIENVQGVRVVYWVGEKMIGMDQCKLEEAQFEGLDSKGCLLEGSNAFWHVIWTRIVLMI